MYGFAPCRTFIELFAFPKTDGSDEVLPSWGFGLAKPQPAIGAIRSVGKTLTFSIKTCYPMIVNMQMAANMALDKPEVGKSGFRRRDSPARFAFTRVLSLSSRGR
jgi:hypothetical protein